MVKRSAAKKRKLQDAMTTLCCVMDLADLDQVDGRIMLTALLFGSMIEDDYDKDEVLKQLSRDWDAATKVYHLKSSHKEAGHG